MAWRWGLILRQSEHVKITRPPMDEKDASNEWTGPAPMEKILTHIFEELKENSCTSSTRHPWTTKPAIREGQPTQSRQVTGCEYYMSINFLFLWWVLCSKCVAVRSENTYEALALYKTKPCDEWDADVAEERKLRFTLPTSHVMSGNWHLDEGEIYSLTLTV